MDRLKNVWVMSSTEFDELVIATWPQKQGFESVAEFEWNNDSCYLQSDVEPVCVPDFQDWVNGGDDNIIGKCQVLEALVHAGELLPGTYLITVGW